MHLLDSEALGLKKFLIDRLEPICDAEPAVLADYVIALLRHDIDDPVELKALCSAQLTDFLRDETEPFLNKLFTALSTKSYMASRPAPRVADDSMDTSGSIQITVVERRDPAGYEPAPIQVLASEDDRRAGRGGPYNGDYRGPGRRDGGGPDYGRSYDRRSERRDAAEPYHRGRDQGGPRRDFGNSRGRGRGDSNGRFDSRPYARGVCHAYRDTNFCPRRETCPYEHVRGNAIPGGHSEPQGGRDQDYGQRSGNGYPPRPQPPPLSSLSGPMDLNAQGRTKLPDIAYRLKKDSLVVENIPPESCSLEAMNEFFKQFGSIVNIKVETRIQKALVQFGHYRDAQKAYEHPGSILGNRFVRVFWFREYDFPPAAGAPSSGAPPTVAPQQQHQQQYQQNYQQQPVYYQQPHYQQQQSYESPKTPQQIALEKSKHLLELQKTQETLIAKQIEEQKRIMTQLTTANLSPKDKKFLVEQLKILTSATQNMVEKAAEQTQLVKTQTSTANANAKGLLDIEKERLDRELDLLSQLSAKAGDSGTVDPALQAKLDALQKEAQTLGVLPGSPSFRGGRGGARGGRGGGRGGAIVATRSFVLDNRARKIIVTGTSDNFLEALQEHSQALEGVEGIQPLPDGKSAVIAFASRSQAEAAIVKPIKVAGLEGIQVNWQKDEDVSSSPVTAMAVEGSSDQWGDDAMNGGDSF